MWYWISMAFILMVGYGLIKVGERTRYEEVGKRWTDTTGIDSSSWSIESYKDTIEGSTYTDPDNDGANQGNNGGEA